MFLNCMNYFGASQDTAVLLKTLAQLVRIKTKMVNACGIGVKASIFTHQIGYADEALWPQLFGQVLDKCVDIFDMVESHGAED